MSKLNMKCNFTNIFQEKLTLSRFEQEFRSFIHKDISREKSLTKKKGMNLACDEVSVMLDLGKHYKVSHLKWTGDSKKGNPFDGILYFNEVKEQKVEISRIIDEQMEIGMKKSDNWCKDFEFDGNVLSDNTKNIGRFIYDRIVKLLENKNNKKYEGCWLAIAYTRPLMSKIRESYIREPILDAVKNEHSNLLLSIRKIFKKIVFVPNASYFIITQSNQSAESEIFEWK